jgi:hypothetical protein
MESALHHVVATIAFAGIASLLASAAQADVPFFNATCPGNVEIHADEGGPVFLNGAESQLHRFNSNYYEATHGPMTVSIEVHPDGSVGISYTRRGAGHGICQVNAHQRHSRTIREQPSQPALAMSKADMQRFCGGEASAAFGVRPTEITTNMAFQIGGRYVVQGWFDGSRGTTFFNCYFSGSGDFIEVR